MVDNETGIQPRVREKLKHVTIKSVSLIKDAAGVVTSGTVLMEDGSTISISISTASET